MGSSSCALIPVDIQKGLGDEAYWGGKRNNPAFEENVARLLAGARAAAVPIFHIKHDSTEPQSPLRPGQPGNEFSPFAAPIEGEPIFEKSVNSAFIGTSIENFLRDRGIQRLVIFGLTTDHCVSTTTRMAANLGSDVDLVGDACATFPKRNDAGVQFDAQTVHDVNLASLNEEFAKLVTADAALKFLA